ncbi:SPFH domain-containing protein [Flavobacterium sp. FlaQc-50]|uniref:SPFH domain-containing protein n=1 Tax=unclassified Flavobacterium TaxID=196869 RepID=UPI003757057D
MVTLILLALFLLTVAFLSAKRQLKLLQKDQQGDRYLNVKLLIYYSVFLIIIFFQPYAVKKIEAGYQGLLVNLIGDSRGASSTKEVSGWKLYNTWTEEIYQIPLDQRSIRYGEQPSVAKGGFALKIYPSFNYSVKPSSTADMFTNLRSAFRTGNGLETIEQGWLEIGILGAVNDVTNSWKVEDIFNKKTEFEIAIQVEANKRVGKWFKVSQLRTNMPPPGSIAKSIADKAAAEYDAQKWIAKATAADAEKKQKIAVARGDSAAVVIKASAEAAALELKQKKLSPIYIEYMKAQKWNGVMPSTVLGSNQSSIINLK